MSAHGRRLEHDLVATGGQLDRIGGGSSLGRRTSAERGRRRGRRSDRGAWRATPSAPSRRAIAGHAALGGLAGDDLAGRSWRTHRTSGWCGSSRPSRARRRRRRTPARSAPGRRVWRPRVAGIDARRRCQCIGSWARARASPGRCGATRTASSDPLDERPHAGLVDDRRRPPMPCGRRGGDAAAQS